MFFISTTLHSYAIQFSFGKEASEKFNQAIMEGQKIVSTYERKEDHHHHHHDLDSDDENENVNDLKQE